MTSISTAARIQLAIIALCLFIPAAMIPFQNEVVLSQFHNRTLTAWPAWGSFAEDPAKYFRQARNWIADRAGFSREATILQKKMLFYVLDTSPQPRVTIGRNNHVFYNGVSDAYVNGLFEVVCVQSHTAEMAAKLEQSASSIVAFGKRRQWAVDIVIVPMTPTLYADYLPRSVPRALRNACMGPLNGNSPLFRLADTPGLNLVYPFAAMKSRRDDDGFFPIVNYHPIGLSLKVIRDAYLAKAGRMPVVGEALEARSAASEILSQYDINKHYPVYALTNASISDDLQARDRLTDQLRDMFEGPPTTRVIANARGDAAGTALMLTDSVGFAAAPVFAAGFKRLIWIYTNGLHQQAQIGEVIDRIAKFERLDNLLLVVNEGATGRIVEWGDALSAAKHQ